MTANEYSNQYIYRRIVTAKLFVDRHFGERINLNQIAEKAHFSRFHFIRLFKAVYGKTPNQYLMSVRIDKAKELLLSGANVSEVCHSVGFDSVSSFKGLFKRYTHYTPAGYKKEKSTLRHDMARAPNRFLPHCLTNRDNTGRKAIFETGV